MPQTLISLTWQLPPVSLSIETIQDFCRNRMHGDDLFHLRFGSICIIHGIRLIKQGHLPFNRLHRLRFPAELVLAGYPYLFYAPLDVFIQDICCPCMVRMMVDNSSRLMLFSSSGVYFLFIGHLLYSPYYTTSTIKKRICLSIPFDIMPIV